MGVFSIISDEKKVEELREFLGGFSRTLNTEACAVTKPEMTIIGYIPLETSFPETTVLYANSVGSFFAGTGWYSDGNIARFWDYELELFTDIHTC